MVAGRSMRSMITNGLKAVWLLEISDWTNGTPMTDVKRLDLLNKYPELAKNPFTSKPLRCEPTPGNITLLDSTNGEDVLWYDIHGIPHLVGTFRGK